MWRFPFELGGWQSCSLRSDYWLEVWLTNLTRILLDFWTCCIWWWSAQVSCPSSSFKWSPAVWKWQSWQYLLCLVFCPQSVCLVCFCVCIVHMLYVLSSSFSDILIMETWFSSQLHVCLYHVLPLLLGACHPLCGFTPLLCFVFSYFVDLTCLFVSLNHACHQVLGKSPLYWYKIIFISHLSRSCFPSTVSIWA